jgi:hypothetical protein
VRIEVTVEDGVAHRLAAVARAAVQDFGGEGVAGAEGLTVEHRRVVAVRGVEPLVRVQVVDVMFLRPGVRDTHLGVVVQVSVVDVRGVFGEEDFGRPRRARNLVAVRVHLVGRRVIDDLRRVADRPRGEEELLVEAVNAVGHRADAEAVG